MADRERRRELVSEYKRSHPEAGVYRILNGTNGKSLLGSALNLNSVRSKMTFAGKSGTTGGLDHRLNADIRQHGIEAFTLEILEVLDIRPEQTDAEIRADLTALEALWREKLDPATLYWTSAEKRERIAPHPCCNQVSRPLAPLTKGGHHHDGCC